MSPVQMVSKYSQFERRWTFKNDIKAKPNTDTHTHMHTTSIETIYFISFGR